MIDGGSTDNSLEIIKKYQHQFAYWVSEPDLGQTDAINKGFSHAKGQILAWINSDDVYYPGAISEAVEYLNGHPSTGMVYGELDFINDKSEVIGKFNSVQTDLAKLRRGFVHIPQPSAFFRTKLWKRIGPLDPSFFFAMDYDLWIRLASISRLDYFKGHVWAKFRLHSDGKTINSDDQCWPEMIRVHYRDGGRLISTIVLKYWIRRISAPWIHFRRERMLNLKTTSI